MTNTALISFPSEPSSNPASVRKLSEPTSQMHSPVLPVQHNDLTVIGFTQIHRFWPEARCEGHRIYPGKKKQRETPCSIGHQWSEHSCWTSALTHASDQSSNVPQQDASATHPPSQLSKKGSNWQKVPIFHPKAECLPKLSLRFPRLFHVFPHTHRYSWQLAKRWPSTASPYLITVTNKRQVKIWAPYMQIPIF